MTDTYLEKLKIEVNTLKEKFDEVKTEFLHGCEDEYININHSEAKRKDLEQFIYTWYAVVNSKQYDESAVFLRYNDVGYYGCYRIQDRSYGCIRDINQSLNAGKSNFWNMVRDRLYYLVDFLRDFRFLLDFEDETVKSWFDFSKESGKLKNLQKKIEKDLNDLKPKADHIDEFYMDFVVKKKGSIENKYKELFDNQVEITIDGNAQSAVGLSGGITAFYNNIKAKNEKIEELNNTIKKYEKEIEKQKLRFKLILGDELTKEEKETAEALKLKELNIKNLPQRIEEYTEKMETQQSEINQMTINTQKALGDDVNRLMVKTFQDEIETQERIEKVMFYGSILTIAVGGLVLWNVFSKNTIEKIDIFLFFRLLFATPVIIVYLLFKKKHDKASLLVSEYRHKKCVIEAMIGYRAKYQTSQEQFSDSFKKEYEQFFEKTFREINQNPSDKVHKLYSGKSNSLKDFKDISRTIGRIIKDFHGTTSTKTS